MRAEDTGVQAGELVVVTGPPGAGKSTLARELAGALEPSALIRGDDFFAFLERGRIAPWIPEAHAQNQVVLDAAAAATGRFVAGGYRVVYDGVVGPSFLPSFASACAVRRLHYVVLLPSEEECLERVATRSGHGFTDPTATRHMHAQFREAAIPARHLVPVGLDLTGAVRWVLEAIAGAATVVQVEPVTDNPGRTSADVGDNGRP